ncbi:MAG: DUF1488 family protein [Symbiopectobacterium sp.]|uniref:DUF1488 family protein n=1 Tax=Symbiopectobacterium sp. TaxID=2952789 RepID=UPI003F333FD5
MNQAIQFPDREAWSEEDRMIYFPVLIGGFQRECRISAAQLQTRFGGTDTHNVFNDYFFSLKAHFHILKNLFFCYLNL